MERWFRRESFSITHTNPKIMPLTSISAFKKKKFFFSWFCKCKFEQKMIKEYRCREIMIWYLERNKILEDERQILSLNIIIRIKCKILNRFYLFIKFENSRFWTERYVSEPPVMELWKSWSKPLNEIATTKMKMEWLLRFGQLLKEI